MKTNHSDPREESGVWWGFCTWLHCSPPPVDPNVGRAREPGVEDVDAADCIRSQQRFLERRVVVEPQALPEPVDRINDHYSTGRVLLFLFEFISSLLMVDSSLGIVECSKIKIKNKLKKSQTEAAESSPLGKSKKRRSYALVSIQ